MIACQLCGAPLHTHTSTRMDDTPIDLAECLTHGCDLYAITDDLDAFPFDASKVAVYAGAYRRIEAMRRGKYVVRA